MNFYKRFIGDIQAKTGGLTLAEFGAYDRLLDHYYSTEQPVPDDERYRICRAMSGAERTAVDKVLGKFFTLENGGWVQSKADEIIAKALPLIEAARANGKKGGRPKKSKTQTEPNGFIGDGADGGNTDQKPAKNVDENASLTEAVAEKHGANEINDLGPKTKPAGLFTETQRKPNAKATQSQSQIPPSLREEGEARKRVPPIPKPDDVSDQVWTDWRQLRKGKSAAVSQTVVDEARAQADKAGLTLERFLTIWCLRGSQGLQADWLRPDERRPVNQTTADRRADTIAGLTNPGDQHARNDRTIDIDATIID